MSWSVSCETLIGDTWVARVFLVTAPSKEIAIIKVRDGVAPLLIRFKSPPNDVQRVDNVLADSGIVELQI